MLTRMVNTLNTDWRLMHCWERKYFLGLGLKKKVIFLLFYNQYICCEYSKELSQLGLNTRKPVLGVCEHTGQTSLRLHTVWSAPLLFAFWKYYMLTCYRWNFNFLAYLCIWWVRYETRFVRNPEDGFSQRGPIVIAFLIYYSFANLT